MRGELGWMKLNYDRHSLALQYGGKLRGMGRERWPKIVSGALCKIRDKGTWVDYIKVLMDKFKLQEFWEDNRWEEKVWKTRVVGQVLQEYWSDRRVAPSSGLVWQKS